MSTPLSVGGTKDRDLERGEPSLVSEYNRGYDLWTVKFWGRPEAIIHLSVAITYYPTVPGSNSWLQDTEHISLCLPLAGGTVSFHQGSHWP